jgi:hypothetical protein
MKQSEEDKMNNVYDEYVSYMKQYPDDIEDSDGHLFKRNKEGRL